MRTTAANFGQVPWVYIETLRDRAISLAHQRRMLAAVPCHRVFSLDTGHSPFLAAPRQVVDCLLAAAAPTHSEVPVAAAERLMFRNPSGWTIRTVIAAFI